MTVFPPFAWGLTFLPFTHTIFFYYNWVSHRKEMLTTQNLNASKLSFYPFISCRRLGVSCICSIFFSLRIYPQITEVWDMFCEIITSLTQWMCPFQSHWKKSKCLKVWTKINPVVLSNISLKWWRKKQYQQSCFVADISTCKNIIINTPR